MLCIFNTSEDRKKNTSSICFNLNYSVNEQKKHVTIARKNKNLQMCHAKKYKNVRTYTLKNLEFK